MGSGGRSDLTALRDPCRRRIRLQRGTFDWFVQVDGAEQSLQALDLALDDEQLGQLAKVLSGLIGLDWIGFSRYIK